jgi:hypothetical protein
MGPGHQRRILQLNDSDVCFGKITAAWLNQVTASVSSVVDPVGPDRHHFGQGCGSGSAWIRLNLSWIRSRIRIQNANPDPDPGGQK